MSRAMTCELEANKLDMTVSAGTFFNRKRRQTYCGRGKILPGICDGYWDTLNDIHLVGCSCAVSMLQFLLVLQDFKHQ